jgi:hypothetical protein
MSVTELNNCKKSKKPSFCPDQLGFSIQVLIAATVIEKTIGLAKR